MEKVNELVDDITRIKNYARRDCCALVTIGIKNTFKSASWDKIVNILIRRKVPNYLVRVLINYLDNRRVIISEANELEMRCGVPQGSILGPNLWNIYYDGVLQLDMPEGVKTLGFADDLAIVARARNACDLETKVNDALIL